MTDEQFNTAVLAKRRIAAIEESLKLVPTLGSFQMEIFRHGVEPSKDILDAIKRMIELDLAQQLTAARAELAAI